MSTISITDKLGLNVTATPAASSAFSKYLKDPAALHTELETVKDIRTLTISEDPFSSQALGFSFKEPVTFGSSGVELDIQPALLATLAIATGKPLFKGDGDPFGETVDIPANSAFLSLAIEATLDLTATDKPADLKFGFNNQTKVTFTDYRLFAVSDPIVPAVTTLVENLVIPADLADIDSLPADSIATVAGIGCLKITAEVDVPASVNPLATVTDTLLDGELKLKAGGSAKVTGCFTISGGYQVRVQRLSGRKFQIGFLKQRSTELDVAVEADVSATATLAGIDWLQTLMQAASSEPAPDKNTLAQVGVTADQLASINTAIKCGVERSLELSLSAELDALQQSSTAFSYAIDLDVVDADTSGAAKDAVGLALRGDLSGLESGTLKGVTLLKSVFSNLKQRKEILKLNVLGVFSVASLTTLVQQGTVIVDQDSGAVTITDKATATRIGFTSANFAKDTAKLRQILAESVMITAAYRAAGTGPATQFGTTEWFFEYRQKANADNIRDYLNICGALGVRSPLQIAADVESFKNVASGLGRSVFTVNAKYDDDLFRSLFLGAAGAPRQEPEYEAIAREALLALLPAINLTNDARRVPLGQITVWNDLKSEWAQDSGLTAFFAKYPALKDFSGVITADFLLVIWWSSAMSEMAKALASLLSYFAAHPAWSKDDSQFKQLHNALNKSMAGVSSNTKNDFREPLGLLSMDLASGRKAATTAQLSSPKLSFTGVR
jgi:hypothetical protein